MKHWTKQEIQIIKQYYNDDLRTDFLKILPNRTRMAVYRKAGRLGLARPRGTWNKKQINENFFDKWSNEMAYVLGFFAADGNMFCSKYKKQIEFGQKEKEILLKIAKLMDWDANLYLNKRTMKFSVCMHNVHIFNQLLNLGMTPKKSLTIKFPKVPKKYMKHFIRGVFDGDGGISLNKKYKTPRCYFMSGSLLFLKELKEDLLNKGVESPDIWFDGCYRLRFNKMSTIKLFHFIYDNVPKKMYMERKYNKFIEYFKYREIDYRINTFIN